MREREREKRGKGAGRQENKNIRITYIHPNAQNKTRKQKKKYVWWYDLTRITLASDSTVFQSSFLRKIRFLLAQQKIYRFFSISC